MCDCVTTCSAFVQIISTYTLIKMPPKTLFSVPILENAQPKLSTGVQLAVSRVPKPGIFLTKRSISVTGRQRMQSDIGRSEGTTN